jgi:3-oxoacyl-[acyl-carrier-protein] synthase I
MRRAMRPLVLTALSVANALGQGTAATLHALRSSQSGLRPLTASAFGVQVANAGHVGLVAGIEEHCLPSVLGRFDCRNNRLADMALRTDGFIDRVAEARAHYGRDRVAVILGTSTSGILSTEEAYQKRNRDTLPAEFAFSETQDLFSLTRFVQSALHLEGPAMTVSTACASSAKCFMQAAHLINAGFCDAAVVGGADSLCAMTLRGFAALELISPTRCRPCDAARSGISLGEAAGFALLERAESAHGTPVATLLGCGASSDGFHMSAPDPHGAGAITAMRDACAGVEAGSIDYINLHGTGTRANDATEDTAVSTVFGDAVPCSSTKGWTGHTLGASGVVEAVISALCIGHHFIPGCLGVNPVDPTFKAQVLVGNVERPVRRVLSNSFGFGGVNCSLLFGAPA